MSKDIKEMNSVEYADYMVQSTRNWKNQQAAAYRKERKKQQRREDWKTLLGIGAQEFVNNSENRLKQMHITNLPKTINYAANLAQGNAIQEERLGLLDKYGTPENIWSAQAASRAFTSPDISKYKFNGIKDIDTAFASGMITPEERITLTNSYNKELKRAEELWNSGSSFDKYDDTYTNAAVTGLQTIKDTKPTFSTIGILRGKDDEYYDLTTTTYNTITEDNTALSAALATRKQIIAGGAKTETVPAQTDEALRTMLLDSKVPYATIKAAITPLINKTSMQINNPERIEARFDMLVKEAYQKNERINPTELWMEARRPFATDVNVDQMGEFLNYADILSKQTSNRDLQEAELKRRFPDMDIDFTASSPLPYVINAVNSGQPVNDSILLQAMGTSGGKAIVDANPQLWSDSVKSFLNLDDAVQSDYQNKALNTVKTIKSSLDNSSYLSKIEKKPEDADIKSLVNVLDKFFVQTDTANPDYKFKGVVSAMQTNLAYTMYDLERSKDKGIITEDQYQAALNLKFTQELGKLEVDKNDELVFKPFSDTSFKQLNVSQSVTDNKTNNVDMLKQEKAGRQYNLAWETLGNNPESIEAKENLLMNAAIIIDGVVKRNPNINTIQKLRESNSALNSMLNQLETVTPTKNVSEILGYLPEEVILEVEPEAATVPTKNITQGFTFETDINISDRPIINKIIEVESSGDPDAVSNHGAKGLMQLKDATADKPGFGVKPAVRNADGSISPEENVRVGTDYFDALTEKYDGDLVTAAMAYNAGPGTIDKWIAGGRDFSKLRKETQDYVKKIFGEDIYNELKNISPKTQAPAPAPTPAPSPAPSLLAADDDMDKTGFELFGQETQARGRRIKKAKRKDRDLKADFRTAVGSLSADMIGQPLSFFTQTGREKDTAQKLSIIRQEVKNKFNIDIDRVLKRSMSLPLVVEENRQIIPEVIAYIEQRKQEILGD